MKRFLAGFGVVIFIFSLSSQATYAHHKKDVLGVATTASEVKFPVVTSGPGFILPDNPVYFLDKWVQGVRLATAFEVERKVTMRTQIAGERLAELRIMMARNNQKGIGNVLSEIKTESQLLAKHIADAKSQGKNVTTLAKKVNASMKSQQAVLTDLSEQTQGSLHLQFRSAKEAIKEVKVAVEDELPEDELAKEIEDTLHEEIDAGILATTGSARGLEHTIDVLTKLASQAAEKNQKSRSEALQRAITVKSDALQSETAQYIEAEIRKEQIIADASQKERELAKEIVRQALETERKLTEARRLREELVKKSAEEFLTPSPLPVRKTGSVAGSTSQNTPKQTLQQIPTQTRVR